VLPPWDTSGRTVWCFALSASSDAQEADDELRDGALTYGKRFGTVVGAGDHQGQLIEGSQDGGHQVTATTTSAARLELLERLGAEGVVMDGLDAAAVGEAVAAARPDALVNEMTALSPAHAGKLNPRKPTASLPRPTDCAARGRTIYWPRRRQAAAVTSSRRAPPSSTASARADGSRPRRTRWSGPWRGSRPSAISSHVQAIDQNRTMRGAHHPSAQAVEGVIQHSLTATRRSSWLPSVPLIGAKLLDLRKRRVLMALTVLFTVGLPVLFYGIRAIYHLSDPAHYGPAGTPSAFATAGTLMAEFGFIAAVVLGATAGTDDLTDGMFRHLVITGRSRLALYLARVPAGLTILLSLAAVGFTVAALVTGFLNSPHAPGALAPSAGALAGAGLWLELYLLIGFMVGLGLGVLMGQRTVPVVLLIVLEIVLTPALADHALPHFVNGERLIFGVAMDQLKPAVLAGGSTVGPGGGPRELHIPPMPTWAVVTVLVGWIVGSLAIGAWKMATRDA
jgi:hypothetical protein